MLRIRELREEIGITQKQLAEAIGNMQRNVSNWEQGVIEPDLTTVVALADYFGVTLDELFGRDAHLKPIDDRLSQTDADILRIIRGMSQERKTALLTLLSHE